VVKRGARVKKMRAFVARGNDYHANARAGTAVRTGFACLLASCLSATQRSVRIQRFARCSREADIRAVSEAAAGRAICSGCIREVAEESTSVH
jgi:hypothetical protein